jgi:Uma2 family endonuclease
MSTIANAVRYTPEELLLMPDGNDYELVNAQLVERNMGMESSWIGGTLVRLMGNHSMNAKLGPVFPADAGYQCYPDDRLRVRKPDVSFVSWDKFPGGIIPEGFCRIAPDLVVEVISPNDLVYEVERKILEYLEAGVRLIWVVYPPSRHVDVHRLNGTTDVVKIGGILDGEDVLPGFHCAVEDIFPPLAKPAKTNNGTV